MLCLGWELRMAQCRTPSVGVPCCSCAVALPDSAAGPGGVCGAGHEQRNDRVRELLLILHEPHLLLLQGPHHPGKLVASPMLNAQLLLWPHCHFGWLNLPEESGPYGPG